MAELVWKGKYPPHIQPGVDKEAEQTVPPPRYRLTTQDYFPVETEQASSPPITTDTWYNRLIQGDNRDFLPALYNEFSGSVRLIYIDPPFMTGRTFSNKQGLAYKDTWHNDLDSYLQRLYETLCHLYRLLADDGSLYIHLDWRTIHYAKVMLDEIFGSSPGSRGPGFKNEIIWHYQSGGHTQKYYARKHDSILLYTKSGEYCFHGERVGKPRGPQKRNNMRKEIAPDGRVSWTIRSAGHIYTYSEDSAMQLTDVWSDISHLHQKDPQRTGYATQKPETLLERIILASSNEKDLVLDCFSGSGVTAAVAERLERRWITGDNSEAAIAITRARLQQQHRQHPFALQQITDEV